MYGGKAGLHLDPDVSLNDIVNVFECCVLNWEAFSIMLPAFVMAGAITVFVPPPVLLKFFGASAKRSVAYSTAAISGFFLSVCSCNIVPLFISIYRRGAGLGPAITFLYAGPAINLVSLIFVYQVIGWRLGFWRLVGVPVIAVVIGIMMAFVFRREEAAREKEAQAAAALSVHTHPTKRIVTLFALLFAMMIIGSIKQTEISLLTWPIKIAVMVGIAGLTAFLSWKWFDVEELKDWGMETWKLVRVIVPVLIVSVLIIGYIATAVKLTTLQKLGITSSTGDNIWSALIVATSSIGRWTSRSAILPWVASSARPCSMKAMSQLVPPMSSVTRLSEPWPEPIRWAQPWTPAAGPDSSVCATPVPSPAAASGMTPPFDCIRKRCLVARPAVSSPWSNSRA